MIVAKSPNTNWDEWFTPFIKFVQENNDVVSSATYVNEGNSRIQLNDEIIKRWKDEAKQSFWLRDGPELSHILGFVE
jgi:hypothetical protein